MLRAQVQYPGLTTQEAMLAILHREAELREPQDAPAFERADGALLLGSRARMLPGRDCKTDNFGHAAFFRNSSGVDLGAAIALPKAMLFGAAGARYASTIMASESIWEMWRQQMTIRGACLPPLEFVDRPSSAAVPGARRVSRRQLYAAQGARVIRHDCYGNSSFR